MLRSLALLLALLVSVPDRLAAELRIVTSIPDLADIVREVGGSAVAVSSIATGVEDLHNLPLRPSFLPRLNRADAVVVLGFGLEHAFMPGLLEASKNPRIQPWAPGYIDASAGVSPLDIPQSLDRSQGEVHPLGNPHFNLDPVRMEIVVRNIAGALGRLQPDDRQHFAEQSERYIQQLRAEQRRWEATAEPLRALPVVTYHADFRYFIDRFGLKEIGTIELKPGIEPTAAHLRALEQRMREQGVRIIIREPHYSPRIPEQLAARVGATVVTLPIMVGGVPQATSYISMIDHIIRTLIDATTL